MATSHREGVDFIASGPSNQAIAPALEISVKTVGTREANGMATLGGTSRAALARLAHDEGQLNGS